MFQRMLEASRAVLLRPSVATFEEFEQDDLRSATLYVLVGTLISAVLSGLAYIIQRPYIEEQSRQIQQQLQGTGLDFTTTMRGSVSGTVGAGVVGPLVGFFLYLGLIYLLGRAFGGTGTFGQLAYDISLYWVPMAVVQALVNLISIGPLGFAGGIALILLGLYNLYLTYLGIQAGMNLPSNKALFVIAIPILLVLLLCCVGAVGLGALIGASQSR